MQAKTQIAESPKLTPDEMAWVMGLYPGCPIVGDQLSYKLELNQLEHMPNMDVYMLCYWYDDIPFQGSRLEDWHIKRDSTDIKVFNKTKGLSYIIDIHTGDVTLSRGGMRSHLGTAAFAFQWQMKNFYAFPLFFEKGHWANGKNPFQLGIAVPNMQPIHDALDALFDNDEAMAKQWLFEKKMLNGIDLHDINTFNKELTEIKKQIALKG